MSTTPSVESLAKRGEPLDPSVREKLAKSDTFEKVGFNASISGQQTIFKNDETFVIWGPASVEVVDKEGDRIRAKALSDALPQLLKRARLSLEHSDQLVGKILDGFEVDDAVTVKIGENEYDRSDFPTDVLELEGQKPALYVAGEIYDDTRQAKETRERIKNGELDSYSISGEALVTRKKVEDGEAYDDIVDMDLSAVTICEEGMNQMAKFGTVQDDEGAKDTVKIDGDDADAADDRAIDDPAPRTAQAGRGPQSADAVRTTAKHTQSMTDESDTSPAGETLRETLKSVLDERLPEGDLATKEQVDEMIKEESADTPQPGETGENSDTTGPAQGDGGSSETGEGSDGSDSELNEGVESVNEKTDDGLTEEKVKTIVQEALNATEKTEGNAPDSEGDDAEASQDDRDEGEVGKDAIAAAADELGVSKDELAALAEDDEDEDVAPDEEAPEAPDEDGPEETVETNGEDVVVDDPVAADEDEAPAPEGAKGDDEEKAPAPDEGKPAPDEGAPAPDEGGSGGAVGDDLSLESLEEQLPADVFEVVREYVDDPAEGGPEEGAPAPAPDEGAPAPDEGQKSEKEDESVEKMVKSILSGENVKTVDGADTTAASGQDVEKSYNEDSESADGQHGDSPALANFYK